jgi:hypothetical protein
MIDDTHLSFTELGESVIEPTDAQRKAWQLETVRDWANESMALRNDVYDYGNGKLGYRYSYENFPIITRRILQAGIRLAGLLNEIYG